VNSLLGTLRGLWRFHRLLAGILVLEYAATFPIILSAAALAHHREQMFSFDSGINESGLYVVRAQTLRADVRASDVSDAVDALRAGATDIAIGSAVPFLGAGDENGAVVTGDREPVRASVYRGGVKFPETLGVRIREGRSFVPSDAGSDRSADGHAAVVILSQSLAQRLFHAQSPLGQTVFLNGSPLIVVGICAPLAGPQFRGRPETSYSLILPGMPVNPSNRMILLRADRGDVLLGNLLDRLNATTAGRIVWDMNPYKRIRDHYFQADRAVTLGLSVTVLAVVLTSLCGVLGLTRYWIGRRQTQIAVRRALGAMRSDILRHFLAESGWLVGCGLMLGCIAVVVAGRWTGLLYRDGLDVTSLLLSLVLTFGLAIFAVQVSLHRLLRLQPIELARMPVG
jgi:putative ABC transport system permease protein